MWKGPNKKDYSPKEEKLDEGDGRQSNEQLSHQPSILSKSLIHPTGSGNLSNKRYAFHNSLCEIKLLDTLYI